jgi:hypothetical protein
MSRSRFFVAARVAALVVVGGGSLAVVAFGCGSSASAVTLASSLCQTICDCQGCNATQRQACEAGFNDADTLAADKGCTGKYDDYVSCVAQHAQCVANTVDLTACTPQAMDLASCSGGTIPIPGGTPAVTCDTNTGGVHFCTSYGSLSAAQAMALTSQCMQSGGTDGTSCSTAGALGTCTVSTGGIMASVTYYAGGAVTATNAQMACTMTGGTWNPG